MPTRRSRPPSSSSQSGLPSSPPPRTGSVLYTRVSDDTYMLYNPQSGTVGAPVLGSSPPPGAYIASMMSPSTAAASSPITPGPNQPPLLPVPNSLQSVRSIGEGFGSVGSPFPAPFDNTGRMGPGNLAFDPHDAARQAVTDHEKGIHAQPSSPSESHSATQSGDHASNANTQ